VGDAPSSPLYRYVYASYIDEPVVRKGAGTGGTIHYFHRNQQYSITAVTTSAGAVAERYAYSAYGEPTICDASGSTLSSSAISNRYSFTGREWDLTVGLHHFRARWMSPKTGRFLGRDPIGYEGSPWNLQEFCHGWALKSVDPSGLDGPPLGPWIGGQQYPYLFPGQSLPGHPHNPVGPPGPPRNPFNGLGSRLAEMCSSCCSGNSCVCASDGFDIERSLNDVWNSNYGNGPNSVSSMSWSIYFGYCINQALGEPDDTVGGYYCYDWASLFNTGMVGLNGSGCFQTRVREITHNTETDPNGNPLIHQYVEITMGNGGPGCTLNIDDGWGNGSFINPGIPVSNPGNWGQPHTPSR
jgi:RHS repeat-associated protein